MTRTADIWHVPDRDLTRYVAGSIDPVSATSVESHVVACAACQLRLRQEVHGDGADRASDPTWQAIADAIDRPTVTRLRVLGPLERRFPVSAVTFGSPTLRWCGALAVAVVLLVPLLLDGAGLRGSALTLLLLLAPLLPLAGVAASYSVVVEPVGELALPTPARTSRLLLWRGFAVLAVALPTGVLAAALSGAPTGLMLGWILPALALCAVTVAAATWRDPVPVAVGLAAMWGVAVLTVTLGAGRSAAAIAGDLAAWAPTVQIVSVAAILVAGAVAASRRDALEHPRFS